MVFKWLTRLSQARSPPVPGLKPQTARKRTLVETYDPPSDLGRKRYHPGCFPPGSWRIRMFIAKRGTAQLTAMSSSRSHGPVGIFLRSTGPSGLHPTVQLQTRLHSAAPPPCDAGHPRPVLRTRTSARMSRRCLLQRRRLLSLLHRRHQLVDALHIAPTGCRCGREFLPAEGIYGKRTLTVPYRGAGVIFGRFSILGELNGLFRKTV